MKFTLLFVAVASASQGTPCSNQDCPTWNEQMNSAAGFAQVHGEPCSNGSCPSYNDQMASSAGFAQTQGVPLSIYPSLESYSEKMPSSSGFVQEKLESFVQTSACHQSGVEGVTCL